MSDTPTDNPPEDSTPPPPEPTEPDRKPARKRATKKAAAPRSLQAVKDPEPEPADVVPIKGEAVLDSPLDDEQRARVEALKAARDVLASKAFGGFVSGATDATALCDVAEFILTGLHPLARYTHDGDGEDQADDGPGLSFTGAPATTEGTPTS